MDEFLLGLAALAKCFSDADNVLGSFWIQGEMFDLLFDLHVSVGLSMF